VPFRRHQFSVGTLIKLRVTYRELHCMLTYPANPQRKEVGTQQQEIPKIAMSELATRTRYPVINVN